MSKSFSEKYISRKHLHLHLLDVCNLDCKHCYLGHKTGKNILGIEDIKKILKYARRQKIFDLTLSGGEPFLYKDLKKVIIEARNLGFEEIRIQTNGTIHNFDKEILNLVDYLCLSLDGPNSKINDQVRGKGTFDKTIRLIKMAQKGSCLVKVNCVVSNINIKYLENMISLLERMKIDELHFQTLTVIGNASINQMSLKAKEWINKRQSLDNIKNLKISVCYQKRFVGDKEIKKIGSEYSCSLKNETGYWVLPDGRIYHCCYLVNTPYYSKKYNFRLGKIEKVKMELQEASNFLLPYCDYGINNNINGKIISICPVWKDYIGKAPY